MKNFIFILVLSQFISLGCAKAGNFIKLSNQLQVWTEVEIQDTNINNMPVILLNGLTYSTAQWDKLKTALHSKKINFIAYDPRGMGKTLEKNGKVETEISLAQQVEDLVLLMNELRIEKAYLVGLSYGGALATAFTAAHLKESRNLFQWHLMCVLWLNKTNK